MDNRLNTLKEDLQNCRSERESLIKELVQTHQAMSALANNFENKEIEYEKKVNTTINSKVRPILNKLLADERIKRYWPEIDTIALYLSGITTKSNFYKETISLLTFTEIKIAALVKNGMPSKEISRLMNISLETVKSHRRTIRKKLKIHNTKQKLSEYLAIVIGDDKTLDEYQ